MGDTFTYCANFGFDDSRQGCCLNLFELSEADFPLVEVLQGQVIRPSLGEIVEQFYAFMLSHEEFKKFLNNKALIKSLKQTQSDYLAGFGVDFTENAYFEERLRVGMAHKRIGMPVTLYQSAYRKLQQIIIDHIPADIDNRQVLIELVGKLTSLDMSLAIETYYLAYIQELQVSLNELRLEGDELRSIISTDAMTGLHSREYILGLLERGMKANRENNKPLSVAMLDIDHFKKVNDTYGHLIGDKVLQEIAEHMTDAVRDADFVGRYGGEEFLVVLCGARAEVAEKVVDRLRENIVSRPIILEGGNELNISLSAGVTEQTEDDNMQSIIDRADAALYIAKNSGRNRVVVK